MFGCLCVAGLTARVFVWRGWHAEGIPAIRVLDAPVPAAKADGTLQTLGDLLGPALAAPGGPKVVGRVSASVEGRKREHPSSSCHSAPPPPHRRRDTHSHKPLMPTHAHNTHPPPPGPLPRRRASCQHSPAVAKRALCLSGQLPPHRSPPALCPSDLGSTAVVGPARVYSSTVAQCRVAGQCRHPP